MASHDFKRVVLGLGLQQGSPDRIMKLAVELADLLEVDLLGLFLEDTGLRHLAGIPFAREFRPLGGGWHPIDLDRLSHDLDLAARNIERMFVEATKRLSTRSKFEVIRGPTAEAIASISRAGDIMMIVEPVSPVERAAPQFPWLLQAAFQCATAVMLVPPHIARTSGPIVAIAATPDDPAIHTAAAVAAAAKEELIVVQLYEAIDDRRRVAATSVRVKYVSPGKIQLSDPSALTHAFGRSEERLIVLSRGDIDDQLASKIAAARRLPVLMIEPARPTDNEAVQ